MTPDHDVVVIGDGPAGAAAAAACAELGLDTVVIGQGRPWTSTYGAWLDELPPLPDAVLAGARDRVIVAAATRRTIDRAYGVFDNGGLREHLGLDGLLVFDAMTGLSVHHGGVEVELLEGSSRIGRWVIDATGAAQAEPAAWQSGYGVVVDTDVVRSQFTTDAVTLMDWSVTGEVPTFCYVVPLGHGWLIEETALATRLPVSADVLRSKLARRVGEQVIADAEAVGAAEQVRIPLGAAPRAASGRVVPFGGAAGMIHPVTGYSVAAALRGAPALAQAIAADADPRDAVWPRPLLRTRALHDAGLRALLRLGPVPTTDFFEAFFSLPVARWSPYMRIDGRPREVAAAMAGVFRAAPWSVRRRLARLDRGLVGGLVAR